MNKIRFALFGAGRWGKNYLRLFQNRPDAELAAVVTKSSDNADAVWRDTSIDCVVIATPPLTHLELAKKALRARKHVLLEKPMTLSVNDTEELKAVARKCKDKILMVAFQYVYNDYVCYIKKEIKNGYFGKIRTLKSESRKISADKKAGVFWDAAPHPLSIFQHLFGFGRIESCAGSITHDSASFAVKFTDKPALEVILSSFDKQKVRKLTLFGENAGAIFNETLDKNKLAIVKDGKKIVPQVIDGETREPLQNELDYFIRCVRRNHTPLTDLHFGAKITEVLENIEFRLRK